MPSRFVSQCRGWHAGTVTNIAEASAWLSYTYLFVRMLHNPLAYGIPWEELAAEPRLEGRRRSLVCGPLAGICRVALVECGAMPVLTGTCVLSILSMGIKLSCRQ